MKQVDVPTLTGAFGILPAHVPTLQVLRPGVVTVFNEDGTSVKYFGKLFLCRNDRMTVTGPITKGLLVKLKIKVHALVTLSFSVYTAFYA